jgi:cobalt-zinc-cadmium efflux system outer membrane protein
MRRSSSLVHTAEMRTATLWAMVALIGCGTAAAQTPTADAPLTLSAAIDRAMTASPAIVAARSRRAIGAAGVAVAGERLNPEARVEIDRDTPRQAYTLAVPWEAGGKRDRRIAVAGASLMTTEAEIDQVVADTRNAVRRAYFDLVIANARVALLDELQMLAVRTRDAAQQRFDAGSAPRLEVLQAELALAQMQNEATGAAGAVVAARAALNALIGLPLAAATMLADPGLGQAISFDTAMARARTSSVELALIDRRIEEQRSRVALARALRTPDITPEGTVTHGFGDGAAFQTGWKAAVAVTIPIFTTHKTGVALEEAALGQLMTEREATLSRIASQVAAATAVAAAQREQYVRYRDEIIPQALQVEQMADDAYRLGQTGIAAYLQALQATRDARLRSLQAEADLHSALTDLERAMGAPLQP